MNILLTGGAGYIGSHTSIVLKNAGHRPIILDNFKNSQKSLLSQLEVINKEKMLYVEGDIRDTRLICDLLDEYQVDAVIHFAALKSISESIKNPVSYYSNNVRGTISLLQAMIEKDVKKLVFSSSATVYGNPQYLPADESHQTHATNAYGRSKLHIEEMLSDLTNSDPKWRIVSLRYFNPVGAHESGLIGEIPHGEPSNLMPFIAKVAARKLPKLNIFGGDYETVDGTGVRDYIHVMDLAEGHLAALAYLNANPEIRVFNLGAGYGVSVLELVRAYEKATNIKIPFSVVDRRKGDVASCYADNNLAKRHLLWSPKRSISDMCISSWLAQSKTKIFNCKNNLLSSI